MTIQFPPATTPPPAASSPAGTMATGPAGKTGQTFDPAVGAPPGRVVDLSVVHQHVKTTHETNRNLFSGGVEPEPGPEAPVEQGHGKAGATGGMLVAGSAKGAAAGMIGAVNAAANPADGQKLVATAQECQRVHRKLKGKYAGAAGPRNYDCSGLTQTVLNKSGCGVGRNIPHSARGQAVMGEPVARKDLQPGDLVFLKDAHGIEHAGIFVGWEKGTDGKPKTDCHGKPMMRLIHSSPTPGKNGVVEEGYNMPELEFAGARRVLPGPVTALEKQRMATFWAVDSAESRLKSANKALEAAKTASPPASAEALKTLQGKISDCEKRLVVAAAKWQKVVAAVEREWHDVEAAGR